MRKKLAKNITELICNLFDTSYSLYIFIVFTFDVTIAVEGIGIASRSHIQTILLAFPGIDLRTG